MSSNITLWGVGDGAHQLFWRQDPPVFFNGDGPFDRAVNAIMTLVAGDARHHVVTARLNPDGDLASAAVTSYEGPEWVAITLESIDFTALRVWAQERLGVLDWQEVLEGDAEIWIGVTE